MIPLIPRMEAHDIHQWLSGGVCVYENEPVMYNETGDNAVWLSTLSGDSRQVDFSEVDTIHTFWPVCGSLNVSVSGGSAAIYLRRTQIQQYRRTYNSRCLNIIIPGKWQALRAVGERLARLQPDTSAVIRAAFDPQYPDFDAAMARLAEVTCFSVAINPYIILVGTPDKQEVFYRGRRAGEISHGAYRSSGMQVASTRIYKLLNGRVTI